MKLFSSKQTSSIIAGFSGSFPFKRAVELTGLGLTRHHHVPGISGSGKSKFIASCIIQLREQSIPFIVLDPHGDLATDILGSFTKDGVFNEPGNFKRIMYVEFGRNDGLYPPFNILNQPGFDTHTICENTVDAGKRSWDDLGITYDNLMYALCFVLRENGLSVCEGMEVLTNKEYREQLLQKVTDKTVLSYFHNEVDLWDKSVVDKNMNMGSTKRRLFELAIRPALRNTLGQTDNILDFNKIMSEGISVILDLRGVPKEARSILGCFLSVAIEQAVYARSKISEYQRLPYHIFIDEFQLFLDRSDKSFVSLLSESRKYKVTFWFIHQNLSQVSDRFRGALSNAQPITFKQGPDDSVKGARIFIEYDPYRVKHTVEDESAEARSHPQWFSFQEQIEMMAYNLANLEKQRAYIKVGKKNLFGKEITEVIKFKTLDFGKIAPWDEIQKVRNQYAKLLPTPGKETLDAVGQSSTPKAPAIRRFGK